MRSPTSLIKGWNLFKNDEENIRSSFNALKTIVTEHERIHAGKAWLNNDEYFLPSGMSYYLFKVDSFDFNTHLRNYGFVSDQGPMTLHLRESPFIDTNSLGTPLSLNNLNRNSSNLPGMTLYGAPFTDADSLGTHLGYILQPEASPGNQPAGGAGDPVVTEWFLNNDKYYLFELNNTAVNTATVGSQFFVYRSD